MSVIKKLFFALCILSISVMQCAPVAFAATTSSNTWTVGTNVKTISKVAVRKSASTGSARLCTQDKNATGTLAEGPVTVRQLVWWKVDFSSGCDGWVYKEYLRFVSAPTPVPTPVPVPTPTTTPPVPTPVPVPVPTPTTTPVTGNVLTVGVGKQYAKPSQANVVARDGDTVLIDAGTYTDDFAAWYQNNLTLKGVGGKAHMRRSNTGVIPNGKAIWTIGGNNVTVDGIEFSNAKVPDLNGAGIRAEGGDLTILNSYFHDNENGILSAHNPESDIVIKNSEFDRNGVGGSGGIHNIYIGGIASFTLEDSYIHAAVDQGQMVKSRAKKNFILYNRITGEQSNESYEIDLSNGGESYIIGNIIQKSPNAANRSAMISYAAEGATNPSQILYVINNTFVNDTGVNTTQFVRASGAPTGKVTNNLFVGTGNPVPNVSLTASNNIFTNTPGFVSQSTYDYRLTNTSSAVNAGANPGSVGSMSLAPTKQYVHPYASQTRTAVGAIDVGAYEYGSLALETTVGQGVAIKNTLAVGWTGEEVSLLQRTLARLGHFKGSVTGYFGALTEAAVKDFQAANNLASVGIVGPKTKALLMEVAP